MKIYITGIGTDGVKALTHEAEKAVMEADILIGAERMLRPFRGLGKEMICTYKPEETARIIHDCKGDTAAVLMSGDCGFFSGAKKLLPLLDGHDVRVVSGISSMSYFCSLLGIPYDDMKTISLHGRTANIAVNVRLNERCFFLLGGETDSAALCRRLCDNGLSDVTVHIGEDLGYDSERIYSGTAAELIGHRSEKLAVLITENPSFIGHIPSAINDGDFIRSSIPMTKSEVRCNAVAGLSICRDSVCWDIGCGTGSVSVEMAFRCPGGRVLAFDRNAEAVRLTAENARRFGCDNIIAAEGSCPEILSGAETPDKVFIGGTSGKMAEIFECIHSKNPAADIAVTAVSLETLEQTIQAFGEYGAECETVQISVTRTGRIGTHTMLQAQNPVFLIRGRLI
ncbi:MAG: precorrin-6y C5,15-methyltransferase (decarboxylating) subunit CbiE [Ruminococcus sp.]|nr:precorrin-6y C5,15-methyltransferase (decarboxylating) subunit CbiE [Ruminococcus sp.]